MTDKKLTGLDLLRSPFPASSISKLPKPTASQTDALKKDFRSGIRCTTCGGWHHPQVVHLDYVGHAALTDRLLECDPTWNWEPMSTDDSGQPIFDKICGMWIKLTVCGVTRLGYGHPDGKTGGNAIKETIGDALRNAAMRFGAALDLWAKDQLPHDVPDDEPAPAKGPVAMTQSTAQSDDVAARLITAINKADTVEKLEKLWNHPATGAAMNGLSDDDKARVIMGHGARLGEFEQNSNIPEFLQE